MENIICFLTCYLGMTLLVFALAIGVDVYSRGVRKKKITLMLLLISIVGAGLMVSSTILAGVLNRLLTGALIIGTEVLIAFLINFIYKKKRGNNEYWDIVYT